MTFPDVDIPLFRLDYSHEQAWNDVLHTALGKESERTDPLTIVDDPEFDGMDIDDLLARLNEDDPGCRFFVIADAATFTETDHPFTLVTPPVLRTDCRLQRTRSRTWSPTLWISNLDVEDHLTAAGPDGIYRATPPQRTGPQDARSRSRRSSTRWETVHGRERSKSSAWACSSTAPGRDFTRSRPSSIPNASARTGPCAPLGVPEVLGCVRARKLHGVPRRAQ
ncbi:DUF6924 domain-containing protein [Rhodococcus pyridinivorans]|uniref:DUF6924 domain-containing protein n=1 Tax=Rhodococcus pyridinivorans TaxID=103816 RepID=UPI0035ABA6B5